MAISETPEGLIITARIKPGSGRFCFKMEKDDIILEVMSPAREGKANQEIMRELPKLLRCEVRILRGSSSRKKLMLLKGITSEELEIVLEA